MIFDECAKKQKSFHDKLRDAGLGSKTLDACGIFKYFELPIPGFQTKDNGSTFANARKLSNWWRGQCSSTWQPERER